MTILALHGLGGARANALAYLPEGLRSHVVAPDVRAHGASTLLGTGDDFALASLAAECADALAAEHDGSPVTIVGVSMGAAIGLRIALAGRFPIDRVAFLRPSFTHEALPANLAVFPVVADLLERHGQRGALAALRASGVYDAVRSVSPAGATALESQVTQPHAWERRARLLEIPRDRAYAPGELANLGAPSVVLASPRDPVHPLHVAEEWAAGLRCRMLVSPARDDGAAAVTAWYREQLGSFLTGL
ncbi:MULTISPECIES: alpha/beta fold hydrolase [unclassified Agrococcus]|uniref:alpha/beta fold hydrolase n=1 Tax=unclassified Agrococcus TaxID=2615065 RepID=UPI00360611AF